MRTQQARMREVMALAPVIPVLVIDQLEQAVPLAQALVRGGLPVLEVTLRTAAALDAMRAMAAVPGAVIGAGTVLDAAQFDAAIAAGAQFAVSPGLTPALAQAAQARAVPLLPGAATASEVMAAREAGFDCLKFFPAASSGGAASLKGFASVFPQVRFCPTGGITAETASQYLALPNVVCVGGSWLAPKAALDTGDWSAVEHLAQAAARLRP